MTSAFDPYHKWLGISPAEQPANYYRLLGINWFESDPDVIESAADQRMNHLRSFQGGEYGDLSQKLLNEVAAAKVCLLKPERKDAYDQALRSIAVRNQCMAPAPHACAAIGCAARPPAPLPPAAPLATIPRPEPLARTATPSDDDEQDAVALEALGINAKIPVVHRRRSQHAVTMMIVAPLVAIIAVLILMLESDSRSGRDLGASGGAANRTSNGVAPDSLRATLKGAGASPNRPGATTETKKPLTPRTDRAGRGAPSAADEVSPPTIADTGSQPEIVDNPLVPPASETTPSTPLSKAEDDNGPVEEHPFGDNKPAIPPQPNKLAIPTDDQQQAALGQLKEILADEFAQAKTAEQKAVLARTLQKLAGETRDDPVMRYVMTTQALTLAVRASQLDLSQQLVDSLAAAYQVDLWDLRVKTCSQLSRSAKTVDAKKAATNLGLDMTERAIRDEQYQTAVELATAAIAVNASLSDATLRDRSREVFDQAKRTLAAAIDAQAAGDTLKAAPDDADANQKLGEFRCLYRDDWTGGLPLLSRGGDGDLRQLAARELAAPTNPLDKLRLADGWWDLAEKRRGEKKDPGAPRPYRLRAAHWYREALPQLNGLMALKAQKRIDEIDGRKAQ